MQQVRQTTPQWWADKAGVENTLTTLRAEQKQKYWTGKHPMTESSQESRTAIFNFYWHILEKSQDFIVLWHFHLTLCHWWCYIFLAFSIYSLVFIICIKFYCSVNISLQMLYIWPCCHKHITQDISAALIEWCRLLIDWLNDWTGPIKILGWQLTVSYDRSSCRV